MKEFSFPQHLSNYSDESLRLVAFCPVCHTRYNHLQAQVGSEREGAHLVHIKCHHCASSVLALILANNFGISSIGLITDLDSLEVLKFKEAVPLAEEDVLAVEALLEQGSLF